MSSVLTAMLPSIIRSAMTSNYACMLAPQRFISTSAVDMRRRRGTIEKQKKKKVKVEVKKIDFYTALAMSKNKNAKKEAIKPLDDTALPVNVDDVYEIANYKTKVYSVEEAVQLLKEIYDPSLFNQPNSLITARIELNMQAAKKTRILDDFSSIALIKHGFLEAADRKILVFCKDRDLQSKAIRAGATLSGGEELVKGVQKGDVKLGEFRYVLAHPDVLLDIVPLRGLMRKKFPNLENGSLDADIVSMIKKFLNGIEYKCKKHEFEKQFGLIETPFGKLSMPTEHLVDNFVALLKDVDSIRPKRDGYFITRCFLKCLPSEEVFKIDPFVFVESGIEPSLVSSAEADPEEKAEETKVASTKDYDSDDESKVKVAKKR